MINNVTPVRRCYGCGAILQSDDINKDGYTPQKHLETHEIVLCQRCFKLQHYNIVTDTEPVISKEFFEIINKAKKDRSLVMYVVDVFNFEASFNREINEALKGIDVILVANKVDLLPKSLKTQKISDYVAARAKEADLNISDVLVVSSTKNLNTDEILEKILSTYNGRNVYFVGAVSSGKSSLIKSILRNYKNETSKFITTSIYPNTTLKVIEIPLDEKTFIYDTPGLSISNTVLGKAEREVIRDIVPKIEIKPRTYQLKPGQAIIIGGLARVDFVKGQRTGFTYYLAPNVKLTRADLSKADGTFESLLKRKQTRPISKLVKDVNDLYGVEILVDYDQRCEIAIAGLGFVVFTGNKQVIRVFAPKGVAITHNISKI